MTRAGGSRPAYSQASRLLSKFTAVMLLPAVLAFMLIPNWAPALAD